MSEITHSISFEETDRKLKFNGTLYFWSGGKVTGDILKDGKYYARIHKNRIGVK